MTNYIEVNIIYSMGRKEKVKERRKERKMDVKVNAVKLKKAISKNGNEYEYLSIMITPTIEKRVFLNSAEKELLMLYQK